MVRLKLFSSKNNTENHLALVPSKVDNNDTCVWPFGGCWCYGVEVTSACFRTDLHKVDGIVTIQYNVSNIINPIFIPLHKQHRPEFILMDGKAAPHHVRIIIVQIWKAGVTQMDWPVSPLT